MIGTIVRSLPNAAAVTEQLVARYGADKVWQIQQMSEHFFKALMADGTVSMAVIQPDGSVSIRELEAVW